MRIKTCSRVFCSESHCRSDVPRRQRVAPTMDEAIQLFDGLNYFRSLRGNMKLKLLSMMFVVVGLLASQSALAAAHLTGKQDEEREIILMSTDFYSESSESERSADMVIASGDGNISGNAKNGNIPEGWTVTVVDDGEHGHDAEMFNVSRIGENSGDFYISPDAWEKYDRIAIGLKFGNNKATDWTITEVAKYAKEGVWSTDPKQGGGLGHYVIYTMAPTAVPVPLPGAFWLLSSSLLGMIAISRKKRVSA